MIAFWISLIHLPVAECHNKILRLFDDVGGTDNVIRLFAAAKKTRTIRSERSSRIDLVQMKL